MTVRYPTMGYDPEDWVDENVMEFGNPLPVIGEMLQSLKECGMPPAWIIEATNRLTVHMLGYAGKRLKLQ